MSTSTFTQLLSSDNGERMSPLLYVARAALYPCILSGRIGLGDDGLASAPEFKLTSASGRFPGSGNMLYIFGLICHSTWPGRWKSPFHSDGIQLNIFSRDCMITSYE